jgi:imidazole glycerol-phosphate synthase subunit HisH
MTTLIVDYGSGNLHSAEKSFQRMAAETGAGLVVVSADPDAVRRADRIVLPGVGAFADCRAGLAAVPGMFEAIEERVIHDGAPFLGICVGAQMMADTGRENVDTAGFGWIAGEVVRVAPADPGLKIPHMGWNALNFSHNHPVFTRDCQRRPCLLRAFLSFRRC